LPILTAYALERREPRSLRRLYDRREELLGKLKDAYREAASKRAPGDIVKVV
jgi:deoxyhypusine synthase